MRWDCLAGGHVGLTVVILSWDLDLTNSLFMKRPMGC